MRLHHLFAALIFLLCAVQARAAEDLVQVWADKDDSGAPVSWTLTVFAYAPPTVKPPSAPAVVLLHGCLQGPKEFYDHSGWRKVADERGILLVVAAFDDPGEHCLWWFEPEQRDPRSARQAAAISNGLAQARQHFHLPEGQNFVTGLSAGAAMTVMMLALHPDQFAAGAAIAGVPFACSGMTDKKRLVWANQPCVVPGMQELPQACACMAGEVDHSPQDWAAAVRDLDPQRRRWPRLSVWQGAADPVVLCRTGVEVAEQWSALEGGPPPDIACPPGQSQILSSRDASRDRIWRMPGKDGPPAVELRLLDGFGHAVPVAESQGCGETGKFFSEAGICAAREISDFFGIR